jgi:hypothetical protein
MKQDLGQNRVNILQYLNVAEPHNSKPMRL